MDKTMYKPLHNGQYAFGDGGVFHLYPYKHNRNILLNNPFILR
jgi:hypothetical protein